MTNEQATQMSMFPEYLNRGSRGLAVLMLQVWLKAVEGGKFGSVVALNGEYDFNTWAAMKSLQEELNRHFWMPLSGPPKEESMLEMDGNFGPATRRKMLLRYGMDFNALPYFGHTEAVFPDRTELVVHPPQP